MTSDNNIQFLPAPLGLPRVETGAIQFGDDWPGLFIRGDNAHALMISIRKLTELLADHPNPGVANVIREHYRSRSSSALARRQANGN